MNSNLNRFRQILISLVWCGGFFPGGAEAQSPADHDRDNAPVVVVASVHPLALLARDIGQGTVSVSTVTPQGADPHDYEPTPGVLRSLVSADLVLGNGAGVDGWIVEPHGPIGR